jgi:hypothetical protein
MRAWQRECAALSTGKRFIVLVLHRRAGKTELALKKLLDAAIKNQLDLPSYFYVAPQLKQAKTIAWTRLKQMVGPLLTGVADVSESDLSVRFRHNGAIVRLYGADNPDAIRGSRLDGVILDETAQMKPEVWEEILRPALADRRGWAWFLGTPKGIDLFSALYFGAAEWPEWASARYTVYDTDALDPLEVGRMKAEMGEQAFAREFLCDFTVSGEDQLISLVDVEEAARRVYKVGEMDYAPRILGVDPARFGNDRSVIYSRQGLQAFDPIVLRQIDNMALAARVAERIDEWKPDAVFIDAGAGSGVIDRLRQLGHDCMEVNFGSTHVRNARHANKRTEMWCDLADWIRAGGAIPNRNSLKLELATPTYGYDAANRKILEKKDATKARMPGHASPDEGDALALTFAAPVEKRALFKTTAAHRDYDPYSRKN